MKQKLLCLVLAFVLLLAPIPAFGQEPAPTTTDYTVRVFDYTAESAGFQAAQGVVLDTTVTGEEGMTGTEVLKAALDAAEIPYVIETTQYGNYLSSVNGLSELQFGQLSGWLAMIDGDQFNNMGLDTVLMPGATLEVHYSVNGGDDVGAAWGGLPILTELTVGSITMTLSKETDYNTYTTLYYLEITDQRSLLSGSGTAEDPFAISVTLPSGTDLTDVKIDWDSSLDPAYETLVGKDITDYSTPVSLILSSATGAETYYTVTARVNTYNGGGGGGGSVISKPVFKEEPIDIKFLAEQVQKPEIGSVGGEWTVLALARGGYDLPKSYWDAYYANVIAEVREKEGVLSTRKYTEYSRVILALTAIGADPQNVAGYDLVKPLSEVDMVTKQGINGAIWALIALDSGNYPGERDSYVEEILSHQNSDGGWSLSGTVSDADLTAMALTAIADYADKTVIDKALAFLRTCECSSSENCAQILVALSTLGRIDDPLFDEIKEELLTYQTDDGFRHLPGGDVTLMSTEQAAYALVAAERAENGKPALYDMNDAERLISRFYDVIEHPNQTAIEALAEQGIINGRKNGGFDPNATMTRAEFCAVITRALSLSVESVETFPDVAERDWYYDSVCAAAASGIVKGRANGAFDPDATITFEEAACMVARAARLLGVAAEPTESVLFASAWAQAEVDFCHAAGMFEAMNFEASRAILRCEIAQMIYLLLEVK